MDHCCEVLNTEEFLNMNSERLCRFLEKDNLNIRCETVIFNAVCLWTRHDLSNRRYEIDKIMTYVRLHLLSPKFLKEQLQNNYVLQVSSSSKNYIESICNDLTSHRPCKNTPLNNPRKPACSLYVIGGYQRQSLNITECFKIKSLVWEKCANMSVPRSGNLLKKFLF